MNSNDRNKLSDGSRVPALPKWMAFTLLIVGIAVAVAAIWSVAYVAGFANALN